MKSRFLDSLFCKKVDYPPIWFMRQAGRYLFEYRLLRLKAGNFFDLCYSSELIAIATLQPLKRYNLDAAIIFSDILLLPASMGLKLNFLDNLGPVFLNPIRNMNDINNLFDVIPIEKMHFLLKAINIVTKELNNIPLIGFSGSPWTLATYMVEGKITKNFCYIKKLLYSNPKILHLLLKKIEKNVISYLCSQIDFGVSALMIFDTWGGILDPFNYNLFSLDYIINIIKQVNLYKKIPFIFFGRNINHYILSALRENNNFEVNAIAFDWGDNINIINNIPKSIAFQGNLDPCFLYGDNITIIKEVKNILSNCFNRNGYIFNLGHGVYPDIDPYKLELIIDVIKNFKN